MADFTNKLHLLSERGTPVGAEELIERIEAELAGDPLVVAAKRREGVFMTKTDQPVTTKSPGPGRGVAWALAAFAVVLAIGGLYFAFSGSDGQVVDQTTVPTPTTVLEPEPEPEPEAMSDGEIIEAGAAALYSGDAATAVGLFDLEYPYDEEIATEAAYQEAIGGQVDLDCTEPGTSGDAFDCIYRYGNSLTDAIGFVDPGETFTVRVSDGKIVEFAFPAHHGPLLSMGSFLALEGSYESYEECIDSGPFPTSCAAIQLENLEAWADWYQSRTDLDALQDVISSWYSGDCVTAAVLSGASGACSDPTDPLTLKVQYESILGAQVSLENCETAIEAVVRCDVHYSNALNEAVGKPAAVINRTFQVQSKIGARSWHEEAPYPADAELNESFQAFAEGGELSAEYAAAGCATSFTPDCANLIMDNLDDWAAWYQANN